MRTITCSWYRAHTEPIVKALHVLKMHDLNRLMTFKFKYKFKKKHLLLNYFDNFAPEKSHNSQLYPKINPQYKLQIFKHEYARNTRRCELINNLNIANTSGIYQGELDKLETSSLYGYLYIKNIFLNTYEFECVLIDCFICRHIHAL